MYFIHDAQKQMNSRINFSIFKNIIIAYENIKEIHKRRYLLKNSAIEIFLINGKTFLFAFEQQVIFQHNKNKF